jgi:hypothetical protein
MRRILLVLAVATITAAMVPSVAWASATDGGLDCWWSCSPTPPPSPSDTMPPTIIDTTPDDGATRVDRDRSITAKFSEAIQPAAALDGPATLDDSTFTLMKEGSTTPVEAAVSYDLSTQTVELNPSGRLAKRTSYTATIEGGGDEDSLAIKDLSGNELAADYVWSFRTGRR